MSPDKQPKKPLSEIVLVERAKGRAPLMTTVLDIAERLAGGERDDSAVQLVSEHGLPATMLDLGRTGLLQQSHWKTWKDRMTPVVAEMVLATKETTEWPCEIREWAAVIAVTQT